MSSGPGQCRRAPKVRVATVSPAMDGCRGYFSDDAEKKSGGGAFPNQQRLCHSENSFNFIKETHNKMIRLKLELQFKEREITDCQSLLEERASRVSSLTKELCHVKSTFEEQVQLREAAEVRISDLVSREYSSYEVFQGMLKKLHTCYEANVALSEEIMALREINNALPNCLDDIKKKLKDAHANMLSLSVTWRKKNSHLAAELNSCRNELDEKSQLCEDAEASNQILKGHLNELQLQISALRADNAHCHKKMQCLVEEHSNVLEHNKSLAHQLKVEKEQKEQLTVPLLKLARKLCDPSALDDGSAVAVFQALGNAVQQLTEECSSLREREKVMKSNTEVLIKEKDALVAENRALAEKQKDYNELQETKERLEGDLEIQTSVANNMTQEIHSDLSSVKEALSQVIRESAEADCPFKETLQTLTAEALQQRMQIRLFYDHWSRFRRVTTDMSDELARREEEVQRLSAECARLDCVIREQKAEIDGLCSGITDFEQLAADHADDLARVQAEAESLRESLVTAQMEAMPVEEREKAALLLLEKDTQIVQLEGELQEKKAVLASLVQEKALAMDEVAILREANKSLEDAMFSLSRELEHEQNRRENMEDCAMQTQEVVKDDCALQTEQTLKDDCAVQTEQSEKVTNAVQTDGCLRPQADQEVQVSGDDEILSKLRSSEHEVNALNTAMKRLSLENEALIKSNKERGSQLIEVESKCYALEERVEKLAEELKKSEIDREALQTKISSLEATLASKDSKMQKVSQDSSQALARLKTENEHLKAEVLKLQERVRNLKSEVIETKDTEALNRQRIERLYQEARDEIQFMKRAGNAASAGVTRGQKASTPAQQGLKSVPVTPKDVPQGIPEQEAHKRVVEEEVLFTPESSPSTPAGLNVAPLLADPSMDVPSDESLSHLVETCEAVPVKRAPPSAKTLQTTKDADGKACPTKSHATAATKPSSHQQEKKPQPRTSPRKGKRPDFSFAVPAPSKKSAQQLDKKGDSTSTAVRADAPAPKKRKFFKKMDSPSWSLFDD